MGFLDKLFGGSKDRTGATAIMEAPRCPHVALVPRWDTAADIGVMERATHFVCEACSQDFTPDQARALQDTASERLPEAVEEKTIEEMKAR